jgi:N-carbamoyl-L-amino-acid hydrolase
MLTVASTANLSMNQNRLWQNIQDLGQVGKLPNGGVKRLAFSDEDIAGRNIVRHWMEDAGMEVRIDTAGNMIGRYRGKNPLLPALATGSHLDTVPNGGYYDGAYGVLAGIEMVKVLQENQMHLEHPLEVIVFTDEEGSMIGSKAISGRVEGDPSTYICPEGMTIQTGLQRLGGSWEHLAQAKRTRQEIVAFVELHVEQGPVLEAAGMKIGVVEGIVGQRRYTITVEGSSSHAGTTPMNMRRDALVAAAEVVLAINRLGTQPGQQVATVGEMEVSPNTANVIPNRVELSLDIRDLSDTRLDELMEQLDYEINQITQRTGTKIQLQQRLNNHPALAKTEIQRAIAQASKDLNLSCLSLPSRASHDAQELALFTDIGMIFVPSELGVSHAETEYTSPQECAGGANVLLHTLLKLDQHY